MSQIHWHSELALFDFNIQYRSGKTNKAADVLSWHPVDTDFEMESISDNDNEDPVMLSYTTICDIIKPVLKDTKIPYNVKKEAQAIIHVFRGEVSVNVPVLHEVPVLTVQTMQFQSSIKWY